MRTSAASVLLGQRPQQASSVRASDKNNSANSYQTGDLIDAYLSTIASSFDATAPVTTNIDTRDRDQALQDASAKIGERDFDGAQSAINTVLNKKPRDISALRLEGRIAIAQQDYKTAEKTFTRIAALSGSDAQNDRDARIARTLQQDDDAVLVRAKRMLKSEPHRAEAIDLLASVSARSPESTEAAIALAEGYSATRRPEMAVSVLDDALKSATPESTARIVESATAIAQENPGSAFAKSVLGRAQIQAGDLNEGIATLRAAQRIAPTDPFLAADLTQGYVARAEDSLSRGATDSARSDLNAAYDADQFNPNLKSLTAKIATTDARDAVFNKRYNKALVELARARRNDPDNPALNKDLAKLYNQVGKFFEQSGGTTQALDNFTAALNLDPDSTQAKRKVAELSNAKGMEAISRGDYDRAITFLKTAFDTYRPDTTYQADLASAYNLRGERFRTSGKYTEAISDLTQAVNLDPSTTSYGTNLALAIQAGGI